MLTKLDSLKGGMKPQPTKLSACADELHQTRKFEVFVKAVGAGRQLRWLRFHTAFQAQRDELREFARRFQRF